MKKIILILLIISCPFMLHAQNELTGQIRAAENGQPLPGATVRLKKANAITSTDPSGLYRLKAPVTNDTLEISFLGYETLNMPLSAGSIRKLDLSLRTATGILNEVTVSTGYQRLPKERATGSFEQINNQLFNRAVAPDVISRLDGVASGVLFDKRGTSKMNFNIRGLSTLTNTITQPLIVVDNFPYNGDINNINPNDVESATLLKDAAAASIWGVRAGNGVLVITTKRGKLNQALRVNVTSNLSIAESPDLMKVPVISTSNFIDVERFLFDKGYYNATFNNSTNRPVTSPVQEILLKQRNGTLTPSQANTQIDALRGLDVRNDISRFLYRRPFNQQYNVQVNGGSSDLSYYLSAGYDRNLQELQGNGQQRVTIRSENEYRPTKKLTLQAGIILTQSRNTANSPGGYGSPFDGSHAIYPYARFADEHGDPLPIARDYRYNYIDTVGKGRLLDWRYRPLAETSLADNTTRLNDIVFKLGGTYQFTRSLSAELRYQYEKGITDQRNFYSQETYFTRNLINRYTQFSGANTNRIIPLGGILDQSSSRLSSNDVRAQLNFNQTWAERHQVTAIAGAEVRQARIDADSYRSYGFNDQILTSANVDYAGVYPIFGTLSGNLAVPNKQSFSALLNRNISVYFNGAYTLDHRYTLSLSVRKDESNLFGVDANRKGTPLGSLGASWLVSDEKFWKAAWLPELKFRASAGYSGNVNNAISALTTLRYDQPNALNSINNLLSAVVTNFPNPNLRWEKVKMYNAGLDFATAGRTLSGSIEYYFKDAVDLIGLIPADLTAGAGLVLQTNSAILHTRGLDITLNSKNLQGPFSWHTNFLFSINKNKVARYLNRPASYSSFISDGSLSPIEGQPAYGIISYKWAGLDAAGNPQVFLAGKASQDYSAINSNVGRDDLVYSGSALPQYFGALRNEFSYGALSLSVNVTYRFDYYFRRPATGYSTLFENWQGYSDFSERWQKAGDERTTQVPAMSYPANPLRDRTYVYSDQTVEKGDHIRLQDIRLNYGFRKTQHRWLPFNSADLYLYANNLGILWRANKKGIDPDYGVNIPAARTYSLGCRLSF